MFITPRESLQYRSSYQSVLLLLWKTWQCCFFPGVQETRDFGLGKQLNALGKASSVALVRGWKTEMLRGMRTLDVHIKRFQRRNILAIGLEDSPVMCNFGKEFSCFFSFVLRAYFRLNSEGIHERNLCLGSHTSKIRMLTVVDFYLMYRNVGIIQFVTWLKSCLGRSPYLKVKWKSIIEFSKTLTVVSISVQMNSQGWNTSMVLILFHLHVGGHLHGIPNSSA